MVVAGGGGGTPRRYSPDGRQGPRRLVHGSPPGGQPSAGSAPIGPL